MYRVVMIVVAIALLGVAFVINNQSSSPEKTDVSPTPSSPSQPSQSGKSFNL